MFATMKNLFGSARTIRKAPKAFLKLETLEERRVMTAGISLGNDGVINIDGYDDAAHGECVQVRQVLNNIANPHDDQVQVTMTSANGNITKTFAMWKNVMGQHLQIVKGVHYEGHAGADTFNNMSTLPSYADGGAGNDVLMGSKAHDELHGGAGDDKLTGRQGDDILDGGAGTDTLIESGDVDFALRNTSLEGLGYDTLSSIEKADLTGGVHANKMDAEFFSGSVTMHGGGGDDIMFGGAGKNYLYGEAGNDLLMGQNDVDHLYGGDGDDILVGNGGDDWLVGDKGSDTLWGGDGDDYLDGGYDRVVDHLHGGAGADTFQQHVWHEASGWFIQTWKTYKDEVCDRTAEDEVNSVNN